MAKQLINLGQADRGNGDPLRTAFDKVNDNFTELYSSVIASGVASTSASPPLSPSVGDLWWDTNDGNLYVYYSSTWASANSGIQGPQGTIGPQGAQGSAGPRGLKGDTGDIGPRGYTGETGAQGNIGPRGVKGDTGETGIQGPAGLDGDDGAQGPQGIRGLKGDDGAQGPQGIRGLKGDDGAQGPQGLRGLRGDTGAQGIQGIQGDQGPTGSAGTNGTNGEQGPQGDPGTQVQFSLTAPNPLTEGNVWWNMNDGNLYVYYNSQWVSAVSIAGLNATNELVNGNKTVSLGTDGNLTLPTQGKIMPVGDVNSFLTFNYGDDVELKAGDNLYLSGSVATIRTNGNANQWIFGSDGGLTFPNGALNIVGNKIRNVSVVDDLLSSGSEIEVTLAKTVITNGVTNSLGGGGPSLTSRSIVDVGDGKVVMAFQVVNSLGGSPTLTAQKQIEVSSNNVLIGQKTINTEGESALTEFSGWTFDDANSRLTLPVNSSILTNETALKIATHSTTTYTFDQAYWAAVDGDITRVVTPTGNAQYFSCTVTANQDSTYTVSVTGTGNSFVPGNWFKVPGDELGGATPANDIQITVDTVDGGGAILTTTITGAAVSKQWTFNADGVLTLPNGTNIYGDGLLKVDSVGGFELNSFADNIGGGEKTWAFGTDGRTTFPVATVPAHDYGAAGDKIGMLVFDADYFYYCIADYVNNTTVIWKRMAYNTIGTW
jgi:hypothetical protein